MNKLLSGISLAALLGLAACGAGTSLPIGPQGAAGTPVTTTVPSAVAGLATFTDTDLKAAITALEATNGGKPPTAEPLVDDYQCVLWMDAQLPTWLGIANGLVPATKPNGPVSAFISVKIAAVNGQGALNSITTTLGNDFAHNCGAAFAQDANFITQALAKVGVNVALPGAGGLSGILSGL